MAEAASYFTFEYLGDNPVGLQPSTHPLSRLLPQYRHIGGQERRKPGTEELPRRGGEEGREGGARCRELSVPAGPVEPEAAAPPPPRRRQPTGDGTVACESANSVESQKVNGPGRLRVLLTFFF